MTGVDRWAKIDDWNGPVFRNCVNYIPQLISSMFRGTTLFWMAGHNKVILFSILVFNMIVGKKGIHALFALVIFVTSTDAISQSAKAENFCQYQDQPIPKFLDNLKAKVVDTRIGKTYAGSARSLWLIFDDSSYFEIYPVLNKTKGAEAFSLKNYKNYRIKCLFYQVPGEVVVPCGCRSFVQ